MLCLYLLTAATCVAAILLPHVQTTFAAMLIFAQTLLILGVVALLEQHPLPVPPVWQNGEEEESSPRRHGDTEVRPGWFEPAGGGESNFFREDLKPAKKIELSSEVQPRRRG